MVSGTSLLTIFWASPSTTAVLPTPGSPTSTGLFLVRRDSTCITRSISFSRPITGSSLPSRAAAVRFRPNWSRTREGDGTVSDGAPQRLAQRQLQRLLGPRSDRGVPRRRLLPLADDLVDLLAHRLPADPQRLQRLRRGALALMDQPEQDMLSADVVVVQHPGLILSQDNNPPRPVGEPLEHLVAPHRAAGGGN